MTPAFWALISAAFAGLSIAGASWIHDSLRRLVQFHDDEARHYKQWTTDTQALLDEMRHCGIKAPEKWRS